MSKKTGFLFWITGFSGSGKTTLAKRILPYIRAKLGTTVHLDGDNLRSILKLDGYSLKDRLSNSEKYTRLAKYLTKQDVNVVFSLVGLMNKPRNWNRINIKNYVEIYIKSDVKKIIKRDKKPHILIDNTFNKNMASLEVELKNKISKIILRNKNK